jgi:hypothetical protein
MAACEKPVVADTQTDAEGRPQQGDDASKELDPGVRATARSSTDNSADEKKELQFGVQAAEATLQVWTKEHLIAAYVL